MADINRQAATDPDKAMQAYREYQHLYQQRFQQFLTADQQKAWRDLTGEPYHF